jgi:hypothetical protein
MQNNEWGDIVMTNLKLAQNFSMIALNAQNSLYMTTVKKVALRCMAAAVILEAYLDSVLTQTGDKLILHNDVLDQTNIVPYQEIILKPLLRKKDEVSGELKWWLKRASMLSNRRLIRFEHTIANSLKEIDLLQEIPNLLGCDLYYNSSGVKIREYRSNVQEYTRITENLRAEILEDGAVTDETICMLWLLRESGCMHDFFSQNELEKVAARMNELYQSVPLAKVVFPIRIRRGAEIAIKGFLHMKKKVMKTPFASGVNFAFPVLERSQSVFIDTEAWFSNKEKRLDDVRARLESNGHVFTVLQEGQIPLIKIDNIVYMAIPQAIYSRVPIHGVRLLPKRPI